MMKSIGKKTLIALLGLVLGFGAVACTEQTTESTATNGATVPGLGDPDAIFFQNSTGTVAVTYGAIYEEFKINDGINQLLYMVDSVLLQSYVQAVTAEEIAEKIKYLKYGTSDDAEIAALDPETLQDNEDAYIQNMFLLGYAGSEEDYVRMVCAKENYTEEQLVLAANVDESWYVGDEAIADYYETTYFDDIAAIKIKFLSKTDAAGAMEHFNLVSYNGTLRHYTQSAVKPIEDVAFFNDTNTEALSDAEILAAFIDMYNYVYGGYRPTIERTASLETLTSVAELQVSHEELTQVQTDLTDFLYATLGSYEAYGTDPDTTSLYYTYTPVKYYGAADTAYYMILKLNDAVKADLSDFAAATDSLADLIDQSIIDEIRATLIKNRLETSGFVSNRIATLRAEHDFVIYDYYLGVDYQSIDTAYELNADGDDVNVATFDSETITADELFAFAMHKNGGLYTLYATQYPLVVKEHFTDVYCLTGETCVTDITANISAKMTEHETTLAKLKEDFAASNYSYYYTFAEFLYLAYGAKSDDDMLHKYYVKSTLQPYLIYDHITASDWALLTDYLYDQMNDYYDNYFSLKVETLQIYLDRDENGTADDYEEFKAGLTDLEAYNTLLADFEAAIREYFADDDTRTYATLITAYNKARREDAVWGTYKQFGFLLATANLSASASLTYLTAMDQYDETLVDGFIAAYAEYLLPENVDETSLYYSELVTSIDGEYLLYCKKGTDFTKPSALFTMTYEDDGITPKYSVGIANENDKPTLEQLKLYCELRFYEVVYGTADDVETTYDITLPVIPTSVTKALEAYFKTVHDDMYVVGFLNIIVAGNLLEGTFVNNNAAYCDLDEATLKARIEQIATIYEEQVFIDYDWIQ
ncbi:MAG: hypothetical protein V1761_01735 [bacterium]